jgi:hypothetical protein
VFVGDAHYVLGDLRTWGWITVILGFLQLLAVWGVLSGNQLARWSAVAVIGPNSPNVRATVNRTKTPTVSTKQRPAFTTC